jgi:hypothetical protein
MRYRKKFIIYSLLAGLIASTESCNSKGPALQLLDSKEFAFPSASAIEYQNGKLYVFGDDAPYLMILSTGYQVVDTVHYWPGEPERIPKSDKPDIESATFIDKAGSHILLGIGSMSDEKRWSALEYNIAGDSLSHSTLFQTGTTFPNVKEINIEGSCTVKNTIILANRANLNNQDNHLLFWQRKGLPIAREIKLPKTNMVAGISGLYYVNEKDILFFTASEEATESATADGEIGESYLGWIRNFSKRMSDTLLTPDQFINLAGHHTAFSKQKIESVCVERIEGERYILHLVADNDKGASKIFKLSLTL